MKTILTGYHRKVWSLKTDHKISSTLESYINLMDNKQDNISSYKITISYSRENKHKNKHIIQKGLSQY